MSVYAPKLLRANLSSGVIKEEVIPQEIVRRFVGGRGTGDVYLYRELTPGTDSLGIGNKLIFVIGPLAGTGAHSCSRWLVVFKSPLTGGYFRSSGGGDFGAWLRFAGLDMVIIEGKAPKPVYLYIDNGHYEIRDAAELCGKNTSDTQENLRGIHGKGIRVACIGPAGEKLVRYANITTDRRSAGRGGSGAVMGSKNLKAVVINATPKIKISKDFRELVREQIATFKNHKMFSFYHDFGTCGADLANRSGFFPTRNFREGSLSGWESLSRDECAKLNIKPTSCYTCMVQCGWIRRIVSGPYAGNISEGPEYESMWSFSGPTAQASFEACIVADALCDDLGLDTMSTGGSIGFAYELFERGILSSGETGGLNLTYGNYEAMLELIKRIANRDGLGDILAEGVKRAALHIGKGTEAYAMHIKGLELPGYEPRALKHQGFQLTVSNCGANHNIGWISEEVMGFPSRIDRYADEGGTDLVMNRQDESAAFETGVVCLFLPQIGMFPISLFGRMLALVTSNDEFHQEGELLKIGERIYNLERVFNIREGFSRKDDTFPARMLNEPLKNAGRAEGQIIRKPEVRLDEYYQFRGWDKNGVPTREKLGMLDLGEIVKDFQSEGAKDT